MKKILLSFVLIASLLAGSIQMFAEGVIAKNEDMKFTDISKHWAMDSINKVVDRDAFADKDGKFMPNKTITRSEFVLMLHKSLNININYFKAPDITEYYDDVKNEDVYASALYDLVTLNIIDIKDHFNPNAALTREEMMNIIMNAYKVKMGDQYKMIKLVPQPFADDKEIDPSYSGAVARAAHMGITKRPANNHFYPKHEASRAQAATVIDRLLNQLAKENVQVDIVPSYEMNGDMLIMKLTITNNSKAKVVFNHSSGYKYDFKLLDSKKEILYTWSADKMFTMALTETVLESGQSVEFIGEVDKAMLDGMTVKPAYLQAFVIGESSDFAINADGYEIEYK